MHCRNLASWGQSALALTILLGLAGATTGQAAAPVVVAADRPQTISLVLKLRNQAALEAYIAETVDPSSASYRKFMTTETFAATFGPTPADLRTVTDFLEHQGLKVEEIHANHLVIRASGTTAQFNALLSTQLLQHTDEHGRPYQKPSRTPQVPSHLSSHVLAAVGLDTKAAFRPHMVNAQKAIAALTGEGAPAVVLPQPGTVATGIPGSYSVGDVANFYNINPLYRRHITGKGRTLGIATLASFNPADAYAYWKAVGLTVDPNRITQVLVDGGSGTDGAEETTLDVQQSGGVAYDARIMVYQAPNGGSGFLDLFSRAISDNLVDTLSVSWGSAEALNDPATLAAYHQVFLQAAVQGIPVFASSGDSGAFDVNCNYPTPYFSPLNSVNHPASDPFVTAAGGTTLPFKLKLSYGNLVVPQERAWGWDYLENYIVKNFGQFEYDSNYFPHGGGGGVSSLFPMPSWQGWLFGTHATPTPFDTLYYYPNYAPGNPDQSGAENWGVLAPGFVGRNVPDISLNADPFTGYLTCFAGSFSSGWGGTSFVAPQLNGIAALLTQANGGRLGFLNPQLYRAFRQHGYGPWSPFHAVTNGTNLYWHAGPYYNPATGLGTLNVVNLGVALDN